MCGIFGLVEPASEARRRVVTRMGQALNHRGPDARRVFETDRIAVGATRLAIVDIANGHQPATDESGEIVAVLNGEIYNHQEWRSKLEKRGHRIDNDSDSAIIPHLYEEHGERFVHGLNGMFAIAIWDGRTGRLLLIRDRVGQKPLYYRHVGSRLAFASELKALMLDPATSRELDVQAISDYLTFQYVPAPRTVLSQVKKVPPAHMVTITGDAATTRRYWELPFVDDQAPPPMERPEAEEQLRARVLESVRLRMMGDRPIGAFLSGGLDSSAVVAAMTRVSSTRVPTFAIGFDEPSHDESPHARRVASLLGTEHHELTLRTPNGDTLRTVARAFDEPFADSSAIPSLALASLTSSKVVIALGGDGGDEAFGGYMRYRVMLPGRFPAVRRMRRIAKRRAAQLLDSMPWRELATDPLLNGAPGRRHPARAYADLLSHFTAEQKAVVLTDDVIERLDGDGLASWLSVCRSWLDHSHTDVVNRMLAIDTASYLPGDLLTKVDTTTMAFSLEGRSPFLDHTLLEWAASLPGHWKASRSTTKALMRSALEHWLPDDVLHRKKQGFSVPMAAWVRGPLTEVVREVFSDPIAVSLGLIRPDVHLTTLEEHLKGWNRTTHVYSLLMLDLWLRERWAEPAELLR
jgi:asparagine synthase (glutamine-hydrolysing)